jgi:hypothetical protein
MRGGKREIKYKTENDASLNAKMFWFHHFIAGSTPPSARAKFCSNPLF